jgi:ZIP family zinc transporter
MTPYFLILIPALVAILGGFLAVIWHPSAQARSLIQHFTAGVILAALAVEILPELQREHVDQWLLIAAFTGGALFMYGMKLWSEQMAYKASLRPQAGMLNHGLILACLIDVMVDGLIIGAGFAADAQTGFVLALGLSVELLFLGLSLVSDTIKGWRVVLMTAFLSLVVLISSLLGNHFLADAPKELVSVILAFGIAVLLYLVTDELLIEAHEVKEKPHSVLWLFAGFLAFWSIQLFSTSAL